MRHFFYFIYCLFLFHCALADEKSEPLCFNSHLQGKNIKYFITSLPLHKYSQNTFPYGFFKNNTTDILILKQEKNENCWLLFETPTHPTHERQIFHLLIDNPILDSVSLYEFKNDSFVLKKTFTLHDAYPSNQSITNYIEFEVKLGKRYLLKVNKTPYSFLPIYFLDNEQYIDTIQKSSLRDGIYFGFILIMCLFIGIFYIKTKEIINLIYTLYLAGIFLVNLTLQGYAFKHIYPNYPEINNHINGLMSFALIFTPIFVYYFLDIHKNQPKFKKLYILTALLYIVCGILSFITNDIVALAILQLIAILQTILFIYNAIIAYKMKQENVIFFFIGWGIYLSSALYIILATSNVINPEPWALRSIAYGSIFEIIFFSAAIAKRFSNYKKENEEIQLKLIESLKEKEKILNEQKTRLEIEVRKRTLELEESNQSLNDLNKNLNNIIEAKTEDLRKNIEELSLFNKQLQQFSFITSHNLRSPVTTLKGLFHLIDNTNQADEKNDLIQKAQLMVNKLDEILIDLNEILNQQKITDDDNIEIIDLQHIIDEVSILFNEGLKNKIQLTIQHTHPLYGYKTYFTSIFYNLISNAIKYQQNNIDLSIEIKTFETNHFIHIVFKDNGIGIDLEKYGANVFGMYKRFNLERPGKGLGLYITKTQVELMKGSIEIQSVVNQGTTMTLKFPKLRRS